MPDISELPALLDIHSRGRYYLFAQPVGDQRQRSFKQFCSCWVSPLLLHLLSG